MLEGDKMRKYLPYIFTVAFAAAVVLMTKLHIGLNKAGTIGAVLLILLFVVIFEAKTVDAKEMASIATLSAIGGVARVPFVGIPGLQPTTFIVAVSGYVMGPVNGFMVGAMSAFISNFFLGQGPWTLWQMLGWGACGFFFGLLKKRESKLQNIVFITLCGLWGYIYGVILNMWYVVAYISPISLKTIVASFVLSFSQDTIHAIGNVFFAAVFGRRFIRVLTRYNRRFNVEYVDELKN